ncbi:isocitrate lyase/phosphoenolpyruvate mutase family protein [Nocardiopsis sp. MG754419]|uniref:isocitrate lyase/PEP mutase family protein n=1 Tax=Nocardiopsis sp. MG754419 TaxID=2259865 RepID=UPI001BA8D16C|nr:isocitrate lyase/phosphoenolpyruvate mutase family protein [Nocardiopsis sp. MG754419]MBR8744273.1 isocitrate lyase/phosphoenolpyruvate mutase family protein [Nocardiopsis sp. MG754419]
MDNTDEALRERGERFHALHQGPDVFVLANAWDAGSARLLQAVGFAALGTTSAGLAHALGRHDGTGRVGLGETLGNAAAIAAATTLPVSADLESGFGSTPDEVARTLTRVGRTGVVGGSVEDTTGDPAAPIRPLGQAVARVEAAVEAARALPFRFTLTARADGFLYGRADLEDTIARLRAFARAGADVVYAPGLPDVEAISAVCAAVDVPVNVLAAGAAARLSVTELGDLGVRRVSLGSGLSRTALTHALATAQEIAEHGRLDRLTEAMSGDEVHRWLGPDRPAPSVPPLP